jgi:hypothetical protein
MLRSVQGRSRWDRQEDPEYQGGSGKEGIRSIVEWGLVLSYLFDSDCRLPRLLLIQDGQTNGARRINIRVEQRWREFAYIT